jgi:CRP-like cAMP-binding protein
MTHKGILELVDIFADLSPEQLQKVYEICQEVVYMQGEMIFAENSPSTEFYVILSGEVAIQVNTESILPGEMQYPPSTIAVLRKGQSFGEIALVDQGVRSASATCSTMTCKLLVINRSDFMALMQQDTEMGFKIMSNLAADLCFKIRQSNMNLRQALLYDHRQKK